VFERFNDETRRVLVLARDEATLAGLTCVGTEHLLLAVLRDGDNVGARALKGIGITEVAAREGVRRAVAGLPGAALGSQSFSPRAKKVLELSSMEAVKLRHNYIGTEHVVLGLVREGSAAGAQVTNDLGGTPEIVRRAVIDLLNRDEGNGLG